MLGSDARTKGSKEPGANKIGQPSRSDSILLMRIGGGHNATLSIPRDTVVDIPGHGQNKINAAYAIGGPALAIRTVEQYLGIQVNHLVEVNFENFPQLIDALGGVTYRGGCVVSQAQRRLQERRLHAAPEGRRAGDQRQAGARARPHPQERVQPEGERPHPRPPPAEDPRLDQGQGHARSRPSSACRGSSWAAPKAIRSDMSGPSLLGLVGAELTAGTAKPTVLKPTGAVTLPDGGAGPDRRRRDQARAPSTASSR